MNRFFLADEDRNAVSGAGVGSGYAVYDRDSDHGRPTAVFHRRSEAVMWRDTQNAKITAEQDRKNQEAEEAAKPKKAASESKKKATTKKVVSKKTKAKKTKK